MEWKALLPREGKYEVFFFNARLFGLSISLDSKLQEFYYTVFDGGEEYEAIVTVHKENVSWVSLGTFDFIKNTKITLSDKDRETDGSENNFPQKLVADAMKWTHVHE